MNLQSLPPWLLLGSGFLGSQILNWGKSAASTGWGLLLRAGTSSLVVDEHEGAAFYWLLSWCNHYLPASTHLLALHRRQKVEYGPAPGLYLIRYKKQRVLLERQQYSAGPMAEGRPMTRLRFTVLGKKRDLLTQILREGRQLYEPTDERLSITVQEGGYWGINYREPVRPLDSVLLDAEVKEMLLEDIGQFLAGRAWYQRLCISWQRGYLLYGPPGNGKTSLIRAVASHFGLPLYVLNLADPKVGDGELAQLLLNVGRAVVLLEDIDAVLPSRLAGSERTNLSFSGLLNALDGVVAASGRLVFMSSNHPEALDAALVRPGRVDKRVLIDNASAVQIVDLFSRFFPDEQERRQDLLEGLLFEGTERRLSMATVQGALLQHRDDPEAAIRELYALYLNPPPVVLPPVRSYSNSTGAPALPQVSLSPRTH